VVGGKGARCRSLLSLPRLGHLEARREPGLPQQLVDGQVESRQYAVFTICILLGPVRLSQNWLSASLVMAMSFSHSVSMLLKPLATASSIGLPT
jgi:hypothetical protein